MPIGSFYTALPVSDLARATAFYADKLGLKPTLEGPNGAWYEGDAGSFELFASDGASPSTFSQMGWVVADLRASVSQLRERGVVFEEYDFPGLKTVDGIVEVPESFPEGDAKSDLNAWFKDSEGNIIGLIEHVR